MPADAQRDGAKSGPIGDPTDSESIPQLEDEEEAWRTGPDLLTSDPVPLRKILAAEDVRDMVKQHAASEAKDARDAVVHASVRTARASASLATRLGRGIAGLWSRTRERVDGALERWRSKRDDVE